MKDFLIPVLILIVMLEMWFLFRARTEVSILRNYDPWKENAESPARDCPEE